MLGHEGKAYVDLAVLATGRTSDGAVEGGAGRRPASRRFRQLLVYTFHQPFPARALGITSNARDDGRMRWDFVVEAKKFADLHAVGRVQQHPRVEGQGSMIGC